MSDSHAIPPPTDSNNSRAIPSSQFYSIPPPEIPLPVHKWRTPEEDGWRPHVSQEPALLEAAELGEQLWAEELAVGGRRKFIVASFERFWRRYRRMRPAFRHLYEVVRADTPCHLYFDLEFYTATNLCRDGPRMVATVRRELAAALRARYGLTLATAHVIELDSSSVRKFSRHLVVRLPGMAFADNAHAGRFVRAMCHGLRARRASEPDADELWVRPPLPLDAVSPTSATEAAPSPLVAARPPPRGAEAHASNWAASRVSRADREESESDGRGAETEQSESDGESPISKRRRYERAETRRGALEQKTVARARTPPRPATSPVGGRQSAARPCSARSLASADVPSSSDSNAPSQGPRAEGETFGSLPSGGGSRATSGVAPRVPPCATQNMQPTRGVVAAAGPSSSVAAHGRPSSGGGAGEQQACAGAHEGNSSSAAHRGAAETCFVDLGVYTRNRCFRLYKSSKFGKREELLPAWLSPTQLALLPYEDEKALFTASLVTHVPEGATLLTCEEGGAAGAGAAAAAGGGGGTAGGSGDGTAAHSLHASAPPQPPPQRSSAQQPCPMPEIETFMLTAWGLKTGLPTATRAWRLDASRLLLSLGPANRWCSHLGKQHRSNGTMLVAQLDGERPWFSQHCYDADCRAGGFRGGDQFPIPPQLLRRSQGAAPRGAPAAPPAGVLPGAAAAAPAAAAAAVAQAAAVCDLEDWWGPEAERAVAEATEAHLRRKREAEAQGAAALGP